MINNRQSGRRRGRGGGNGSGGGGGGQRQGGQQGNGSRIDNRSRGNATQLFEKYKNMAADAQRAGDRVNTEYYLQFADHYFRVLAEQRGRFDDQQPQQQRVRRDEFDYEGDDEFGDEGEPIRAGEQDVSRANGDGPRQSGDGQRANGNADRDGRPREFRRDRENGDGRDGNRDRSDHHRGGESRADGNRGANGDGANRDGANRDGGARPEWRDRNDRGGERRPFEPRNDARPIEPELIAGQRRAEPLGAGESLEHRAEEVLEADRPLDPPARRRGRPPRREIGDAEPAALDADRLPPALTPTLTMAANDEDAVDAAPRRRRVRRPVDETPTAAE